MKTLFAKSEMLTDANVIEKILEGDTAVFEILIRRFNAVLYKIGRMYGLSHQDTEELMQDTHVAAYMQLAAFQNRSSYKTWISRIMINKCIYKNKYGIRKEVSREEIPELNSSFIQTDRNMLNRELSGVLEKSLDNIPEIYRTVFVMREIEGFSVAETADLMGISNVNVKVRLNRAKTLLQKQVEQFYSVSDIYSFNLIYCDNMVNKTFEAINKKSPASFHAGLPIKI